MQPPTLGAQSLPMNHYEVLEVSPKASPQVVKAAYKSLIQRFHPDRNPDDPAAAQHASRLTEAYLVLSDAEQRQAYDVQLRPPLPLPVSPSASRPPQKPLTPDARRTTRLATRRTTDSAGTPDALYFWLIVAVIVAGGGLSLSLLKPPQSGVQLATTGGAMLAQTLPLPAPAVAPHTTTYPLGTVLRVTLQAAPSYSANSPGAAEPAVAAVPAVPIELTIPVVLIHLGSVDPAEFSRLLDDKKDALTAELKLRLAAAKPEELLKTSGPLYLNKFLLDALQEITGAARPAGLVPIGPAAGEPEGRYGIAGVSLPDAFFLAPLR